MKRSYAKNHKDSEDQHNKALIIELQNEIKKLKKEKEELEDTVAFLRNFV